LGEGGGVWWGHGGGRGCPGGGWEGKPGGRGGEGEESWGGPFDDRGRGRWAMGENQRGWKGNGTRERRDNSTDTRKAKRRLLNQGGGKKRVIGKNVPQEEREVRGVEFWGGEMVDQIIGQIRGQYVAHRGEREGKGGGTRKRGKRGEREKKKGEKKRGGGREGEGEREKKK